MAKLTDEQAQMLSLCIKTGCAWVTSPTSPASQLLNKWEAEGWTEKCEAPADFLVAYRFTDRDRAALSQEGE